jgi:hypothetical protein
VQAAAAIQSVQFAGSAEGRLSISVGGEVHISAAQFESLAKQVP